MQTIALRQNLNTYQILKQYVKLDTPLGNKR